MAQVTNIASVRASDARNEDFDAMLDAFDAEQIEGDLDELCQELATESEPKVPASWQTPLSRAEHRLKSRITKRANSKPMPNEKLVGLLDEKMDLRGRPDGYKATAYNATLILQNDPRTHGALSLDLFTGNIRVEKPVQFRTVGLANISCEPGGDNFWDDHEGALNTWLGSPVEAGGWGLVVGAGSMANAVRNAAYQNASHPIYEQITSAKWDGQPRLDTALTRWLRLDERNQAYNHAVSRLTFVAAVTRLLEPGHKFDFMPVLQGIQGSAKSSLIEVWSLGYFGEISEPRQFTDSKVMNEMTAGKWFIELPELAALLGVNSRTVKSKLSSKADRARAAYSKYTEERKRGFITVGTSNDKGYLIDPTGNRRFWPLMVGATEQNPVDLAAVRAEIQQVYAEAIEVYRQMRCAQHEGDLPLFLTGEADEIAKRLQGMATIETPEHAFAGWLTGWLSEPSSGKFSRIEVGGLTYRDRFCMREAFEAYHRDAGVDRVPDYDAKAAALVRGAIDMLPFVSKGATARFERYGAQQSYAVDPEWLEAQVTREDAEQQAASQDAPAEPQTPKAVAAITDEWDAVESALTGQASEPVKHPASEAPRAEAVAATEPAKARENRAAPDWDDHGTVISIAGLLSTLNVKSGATSNVVSLVDARK